MYFPSLTCNLASFIMYCIWLMCVPRYLYVTRWYHCNYVVCIHNLCLGILVILWHFSCEVDSASHLLCTYTYCEGRTVMMVGYWENPGLIILLQIWMRASSGSFVVLGGSWLFTALDMPTHWEWWRRFGGSGLRLAGLLLCGIRSRVETRVRRPPELIYPSWFIRPTLRSDPAADNYHLGRNQIFKNVDATVYL